MMLIDADALREQMVELHKERSEEANMTGDRVVCVTWHDAVICIKNSPTVDAVPVVRCRECIHRDKRYEWHGDYNCKLHHEPKSLDFFCSEGEHGEDGDNDG